MAVEGSLALPLWRQLCLGLVWLVLPCLGPATPPVGPSATFSATTTATLSATTTRPPSVGEAALRAAVVVADKVAVVVADKDADGPTGGVAGPGQGNRLNIQRVWGRTCFQNLDFW